MSEQLRSDRSRSLARRALERELANVDDNLYRYQMQYRADPSFETGNGEPIRDVIDRLTRDRDALRDALEDYR